MKEEEEEMMMKYINKDMIDKLQTYSKTLYLERELHVLCKMKEQMEEEEEQPMDNNNKRQRRRQRQ